MRRLLTAILLLVCPLALLAQGGLGHSVKGTVVDASSGRPVAAVSVLVPGQNYATVTNADGTFIIKSDKPISELRFSRIGYRDARAKTGQGEISVRITPIAYPLQEASIVTGDPREIIDAAMDRIRDNYPSKPELLRCFYRETLQKRQRYISVNEAVSRIYKTPYHYSNSSLDRAALEKSRVIMSHIADRLQFVISFAPASAAEYALYYGKFYIDRETLAFSRIELSLDMSDEAKATRVMLVRKPLALRFTPKELTLAINYRQEGGQARMDYFRSSMSFRCDWKKRLIATNYTVVNELVVTDVVEPAVPIPRNEMFKPSDVLDDMAPLFLDPDFWKDYNIIEPSESLEHAVARLRK